MLGSTPVPAKVFRVIEVPRDGNCLFTAVAVCRMAGEGKRFGIEDELTQKDYRDSAIELRK